LTNAVSGVHRGAKKIISSKHQCLKRMKSIKSKSNNQEILNKVLKLHNAENPFRRIINKELNLK
jgi:hypothetical protein